MIIKQQQQQIRTILNINWPLLLWMHGANCKRVGETRGKRIGETGIHGHLSHTKNKNYKLKATLRNKCISEIYKKNKETHNDNLQYLRIKEEEKCCGQ